VVVVECVCVCVCVCVCTCVELTGVIIATLCINAHLGSLPVVSNPSNYLHTDPSHCCYLNFADEEPKVDRD
jgi:hypothetical protein